jgi:pimeloyl-ACP methyl ester carboxylesterase
MVNYFSEQMVRPIVGIGHSLGGNQLSFLSLIHPRLFTALVSIEAVVTPLKTTARGQATGGRMAALSSFRRDIWPSRDVAEKSMMKSPMYKAWDKKVFDLWMKYGLRDLPTTLYETQPDSPDAVTLTTTKHQEVYCYIREILTDSYDRIAQPDMNGEVITMLVEGGFPFYRPELPFVWHALPTLRPAVLYVNGEKSFLNTPEELKYKREMTGTGLGGSGGAAAGKVEEAMFENGTHFIPFETPGSCAEVITEWLERILKSWREEEARFNKEWYSKAVKEKVTLRDSWLKRIKPVAKI